MVRSIKTKLRRVIIIEQILGSDTTETHCKNCPARWESYDGIEDHYGRVCSLFGYIGEDPLRASECVESEIPPQEWRTDEPPKDGEFYPAAMSYGFDFLIWDEDKDEYFTQAGKVANMEEFCKWYPMTPFPGCDHELPEEE